MVANPARSDMRSVMRMFRKIAAPRARLLKHQGNKRRDNPSYHAMALTRQGQLTDKCSAGTVRLSAIEVDWQARSRGQQFHW
jgi:hypothetical protein